uniref:Uncharacterized protein n=1 Tax=Panagrolaimus sp. JU765 TaxID=591449 RepID=A0AC34R834_9BILA
MLRTTDSGSSSSSTQIRKTNEPPKIVHRVVRPIGGRMPIVRKLRPPLKVGQRPSGPRMMIRHVTPIRHVKPIKPGPRMMIRHVTPIRHVKPIKPGIPQQIVKTVVVQPKIVTVRPATTKKEAGNSQIEKVEKSSMESPKPSSSTSTQSVEAVPTPTEAPFESSTAPVPETKTETSAETQPPEDEDAEINVVD